MYPYYNSVQWSMEHEYKLRLSVIKLNSEKYVIKIIRCKMLTLYNSINIIIMFSVTICTIYNIRFWNEVDYIRIGNSIDYKYKYL